MPKPGHHRRVAWRPGENFSIRGLHYWSFLLAGRDHAMPFPAHSGGINLGCWNYWSFLLAGRDHKPFPAPPRVDKPFLEWIVVPGKLLLGESFSIYQSFWKDRSIIICLSFICIPHQFVRFHRSCRGRLPGPFGANGRWFWQFHVIEVCGPVRLSYCPTMIRYFCLVRVDISLMGPSHHIVEVENRCVWCSHSSFSCGLPRLLWNSVLFLYLGGFSL